MWLKHLFAASLVSHQGKYVDFLRDHFIHQAHALSHYPPHHGGTQSRSVAMKVFHPDIDTAVFYAVTVFCAVLLMAL